MQTRDDEIGPATALAVEQDFGDRETEPPAQLRQRGPLRDKLTAKHRRKNLQDQFIAETDDEVGSGRETCGVPG